MTVDLDDRNTAWAAVLDPSTDPTTLAAIAARYEEFGPRISAHANSYAGLREWIAARAADVRVVVPVADQPVAVADQPVVTLVATPTPTPAASPRRAARVLWIVALVLVSFGGPLAAVTFPGMRWGSAGALITAFVVVVLVQAAALGAAAIVSAPTGARKVGGALLALAFGAALLGVSLSFGMLSWVRNVPYGWYTEPGLVLAGPLVLALAFSAFAVSYPLRALGFISLPVGMLFSAFSVMLQRFPGVLGAVGFVVEIIVPAATVLVALLLHHVAERRLGIRPAARPVPDAAAVDPLAAQRTNVLAILALVFGVIGGTVLAIVFGHVALSQIRRTGESGRGLALAGLVLGYIGIAILVLAILVAVFLSFSQYR